MQFNYTLSFEEHIYGHVVNFSIFTDDSIITAAYFLIPVRLRGEVWDMIRKIVSFFGVPNVEILIHNCMYFGELYNVCN
jgi:hypothetical protein